MTAKVTGTSDVRELTVEELDFVSGGEICTSLGTGPGAIVCTGNFSDGSPYVTIELPFYKLMLPNPHAPGGYRS